MVPQPPPERSWGRYQARLPKIANLTGVGAEDDRVPHPVAETRILGVPLTDASTDESPLVGSVAEPLT